MKLAVVGTGISGMVAASILSREHEVHVFEANDRVGGHTHTVDVEIEGSRFAVDTGFIVHNTRTYPKLIQIFDQLGVPTRETSMSFSVNEEASEIEYSSRSIFARRRNALSPRVVRMVHDILRFNREAASVLVGPGANDTLGAMLDARGYSRAFIDLYIIPMGAAIWSTDPSRMLSFPARSFVRFLMNHGLTSLTDRPTWRVVEGGSREYVRKLIEPFARRIRLNSPVRRISRELEGVTITAGGEAPERFDRVVIAAHSDQALAMLADPSFEERAILGAIEYQPNETVLHTDISLLPKRRRAWASWNYLVPRDPRNRVIMTYDMNALQGIDTAPVTFCVSLNADERIDPSKVLYRTTYHHPLFTPESVAAQARIDEISGVRNTYYCGAYWRYGFHEDGVVSAIAVAEKFGLEGRVHASISAEAAE